MRKQNILFIQVIIMLIYTGCGNTLEPSSPPTKMNGKHLDIYTTAKDTELKLTHTATLSFEQGRQATEGELSIFVKPAITFQELVGIGSSITDASAEVFAGLSEEKQHETSS